MGISRSSSLTRQALVSAIGLLGLLFTPTAWSKCDTPIWVEDFDSYMPGIFLAQTPPGSDWEAWDGDPMLGDAELVAAPNQSPPLSLQITDTDDIVRLLSIGGGTWDFVTSVRIESGITGSGYFILLNQYVSGGPKNWSTQIRFDTALGQVVSEPENAALPLTLDSWVQLRVHVNLQTNRQYIYYGDVLLSAKSWTEGVSGGGSLTVEAMNFFGSDIGEMYFDDVAQCQSVSATPRILIASAGDDDPMFRSSLAGLLGGAQVDYQDARVTTPTVDSLASYDAIFVWAIDPFANAIEFGNRLGNFVQAGRCVILGTGCASALSSTNIMSLSPAVCASGGCAHPTVPNTSPYTSMLIQPDCGQCQFRLVSPVTSTTSTRADRLQPAGPGVGSAGWYPSLGNANWIANGNLEPAGIYWPNPNYPSSGAPYNPPVVYANGADIYGTDIPCWIASIVEFCHSEECPMDVNIDGVTDVQDLVEVILAFGSSCETADGNADGTVDVSDLVLCILGWGECSAP